MPVDSTVGQALLPVLRITQRKLGHRKGQAGMPVLLPAMVGGMALFDGDKRAATGGAHFVVRD